jgi:D-arabinose 1-dehydrogenase-like Zn-dependent alcohol dehydrogenase
MRSMQFDEYGAPLKEFTYENPQPAGKEVLVRIEACGVCHSDIHLHEGYFDMGGGNKADVTRGRKLPFTLGHEIVGEVVAVGDAVTTAKVGDKRIVYPWIGCMACATCEEGHTELCGSPRNLGVQVDGGYADHIICPDEQFLYDYGDVPTGLAATYACSGITAYGALMKAKPNAERGGFIGIIGVGGVGMAGLMIAKATFDAKTIVFDIDPAKLEAAKAAGADYVFDPSDKATRKEVAKLTGGGLPAAVDFVGSDKTATFGVTSLGASGILVIIGLFGGAMTIPVPLFPFKNITVRGSLVGSPGEMAELMDLVKAGKVPPMPVAERPLDQAWETLEDLRAGKIVGRIVLTP